MGRRPVLQRRAGGAKDFVVPELMEDGQRIPAAITHAQAGVKQLQADMRKIHERLDRGFSPHYESKVARNARCTLGRHAGIRTAGVPRGPIPAPTGSSRTPKPTESSPNSRATTSGPWT